MEEQHEITTETSGEGLSQRESQLVKLIQDARGGLEALSDTLWLGGHDRLAARAREHANNLSKQLAEVVPPPPRSNPFA